MDKLMLAGDYFEAGYCCAESVLLSIARQKGIESDLIPRIATGFCGGVARTGGMCGALSGAVMGLGLLFGRDEPGQPRDEFYACIQLLMNEFSQQFGSTVCRQLTDCDLNTPDGHAFYKANQLKQKCLAFSNAAASFALAMIEENG